MFCACPSLLEKQFDVSALLRTLWIKLPTVNNKLALKTSPDGARTAPYDGHSTSQGYRITESIKLFEMNYD